MRTIGLQGLFTVAAFSTAFGLTGCSASEQNATDTAATESAPAAFRVDTREQLPACDASSEGVVAYIAAEGSILACVHSEWEPLFPTTAGNGEKGDKGDKGDTGATGATGATGPEGIEGRKGATGAAGAMGPRGYTGVKGDTGEQGVQGMQGLKGDTGEKGEKGDKGEKGEDAVGAPVITGHCYESVASGGVSLPLTQWSAAMVSGTMAASPEGVHGCAGAVSRSGGTYSFSAPGSYRVTVRQYLIVPAGSTTRIMLTSGITQGVSGMMIPVMCNYDAAGNDAVCEGEFVLDVATTGTAAISLEAWNTNVTAQGGTIIIDRL